MGGILGEELKNSVEKTIKKNLDSLLTKTWGYSTETKDNVEKDVFKKLEAVVSKQLHNKADAIIEETKLDLDTIVEDEVKEKMTMKDLKEDIIEMKEILLENE